MTKLSTRICDQCHSKHLRCDRLPPNCSRCLKSNLKCSWNRLRVLPKNANFEIKNYFVENTSKINTQQIARRRKVNKCDSKSISFHSSKVSSEDSYLSLVTIKPPLLSLCVYSVPKSWVNIFSFWNSTTIRRNTFKVFLNSCNVSIENPRDNNFKIFANVMIPQNLPRKRANHLPLQLAFSEQDIASLINKAIKAYFYYFNPFFPLFTYDSFCQRPRSQFLKYVITCIGLRFLPRSDLRDQLVSSLEAKILILKKLSNLKLNLDTLQALLCIYAGLVWSSVEGMNYSLFLVAISIMYSIGLHRGKHQKDPAIFLERSLAFHVTCYLSSKFFIEGVSNFNLEGISNRNFSNKISTFYPFKLPSLLNSIHQPLNCDQLESLYLMITEQLHHSSYILNETNKAIINNKHGRIRIVLRAEKNISKLLQSGLIKLHNKVRIVANISSDEFTLSDTDSVEFRHSSFFELIHVFRIRICFDLIRLLDLVFRIESNKIDEPELLNLYKKASKYSTFVIKGLAAINPKAPFIFYRPIIILYTARVALQASRYYRSESVDQLIKLSLEILHDQSKLEMYSYSGVIQKELLEALSKKPPYVFLSSSSS